MNGLFTRSLTAVKLKFCGFWHFQWEILFDALEEQRQNRHQRLICSPCFCTFYTKVYFHFLSPIQRLKLKKNYANFKFKHSPDSTCYPGKVDRQPSFVLQPKYIQLVPPSSPPFFSFFLFDHYLS